MFPSVGRCHDATKSETKFGRGFCDRWQPVIAPVRFERVPDWRSMTKTRCKSPRWPNTTAAAHDRNLADIRSCCIDALLFRCTHSQDMRGRTRRRTHAMTLSTNKKRASAPAEMRRECERRGCTRIGIKSVLNHGRLDACITPQCLHPRELVMVGHTQLFDLCGAHAPTRDALAITRGPHAIYTRTLIYTRAPFHIHAGTIPLPCQHRPIPQTHATLSWCRHALATVSATRASRSNPFAD
jgi:hypothetical protein